MADLSFFKRLLSEKIPDLWQKKGESILGIDIGSSSIKLVQLRKEKERAVLETYGELSVGNYANVDVGRAAILSIDKTVEMLKDLLVESGAKSKSAVVSIPLKSSFVTMMTLPKMSDKELAESIPYEARRYIPIPISEVEMDWWVVPQGFSTSGDKSDNENSKKKAFSEVLLVAIHNNIIEQHKTVMKKIGVVAETFEIEVFSTVRSSLARELVPILIIDFGASSIKMTIVDYGIVRVAHSLDRGSQDITAALSSSLGIDFARAEKLKREVGLSDRPEHKEIANVISPLLDYIFSEGTRLASDYRVKHGRSVSRVILTGGGALLKGMVDSAVNKFGIEVGLTNPFIKLEYPAFLEPALREIGPNFSTSIGLALRALK